MKETHDSLYAAFKAKDTRFDGRFFVGILSTKIAVRGNALGFDYFVLVFYVDQSLHQEMP